MEDASQAVRQRPAEGLPWPLVPPNVVGLAELAQLLGVDKNTVLRYAKRRDFPEPARLASGPVWSRREVDAWAAKVLPLPTGRPRKHPPKTRPNAKHG
jgi:predicted DNA-binding transcriptional regulator AlpA